MEAAEEASVLNFDATVLHEGETSALGDLSGFFVANAELEPEHFGTDGGSFPRDRGRVLGFAEDIDNLDLLASCFGLGEGGIDTLAEQGLSGVARVDGDDVVALGLQIDGDEVARSVGVSGDADDGDMVVGL